MAPRSKGKTEKKPREEQPGAESSAKPESKPKAQPKAKSKSSKKQKTVEEAIEIAGEAKAAEAALVEPSPAEEAKQVAAEQIEELKEEKAEEEEEIEEAKPKAEKKKEAAEEEEEEEEELEIVEEKFYDLNLRRVWATPRGKRTPRAVRFLREFVARRMKTDDIAISEEANSMLWARGISKPPRKIRVRAVKDKEGHVIVFPGEGK